MAIICAIDVGSNSIRQMIARVNKDSRIQILYDQGKITRLGENVLKRGELDLARTEKSMKVIKEYANFAKRKGAKRIEAIGTGMLRKAGNRKEFIKRVKDETGLRLRVITGFEEAKLTYLGAASSLNFVRERILVVDIGGGSTEFMAGDQRGYSQVLSIVLGSGQITDDFVTTDPINEYQFNGMLEFARKKVHPILKKLEVSNSILIGVGGTVTSLACMAKCMRRYDDFKIHGYILKGEVVSQFLFSLMKKTKEERRKVVGLEHGRADVIVGGTLILHTILEAACLKELIVSSWGIRLGMTINMANKNKITKEIGNIEVTRV